MYFGIFVYLNNGNNGDSFVHKIVTESQEFVCVNFFGQFWWARALLNKEKMTIFGNDQMFFIFIVVAAVVAVSFYSTYVMFILSSSSTELLALEMLK